MPIAHTIPVPTPFDVGDVNCYVLDRGRLTLIDPGPSMDESLRVLRSGLEQLGHTLEQVERVLITHPHLDHFGLASAIKQESGAQIGSHPDARGIVADFEEHYREEREYFTPFLIAMGMPPKTTEMVTELPESYIPLAQSVNVDWSLRPGEVIEGEVPLRCIDSPGHSHGSFSYYAPEHDLVFTGDHVLSAMTPNPLLQMPMEGSRRKRSLLLYQESLRNLRQTVASSTPARGLGGHGPPIEDVPQRVEDILDHHERRTRTFYRMLDQPRTAYEMMNQAFPDIPLREYFLGMSEVIGHLDVLEERGEVEIVEDGDVLKYRRI